MAQNREPASLGKDDYEGSVLQSNSVFSGQLLILVNVFPTEVHVRAGGMSPGRKPRCGLQAVGCVRWSHG